MASQGFFSIASKGLNVGVKVQIGSLTGRQAFTTWIDNTHRQMEGEARRRLFRAAAWCRTSVRRSMKLRRTTRKDYKGFGMPSYPPSAPGTPPNRRRTNKSGLYDIRFDNYKKDYMRIGPQIYTDVGKKTNFSGKGDRMIEAGGTGLVRLPLDPDQMPEDMFRDVIMLKKYPHPWVMKRSFYKPRPYMAPALPKTLAQFPKIFGNLNETRVAPVKA